MKCFYLYILTNKYRTTLYVGVTNNIERRLSEHIESTERIGKSFVSRYNLKYLVYYETHDSILDAIERENQIKRWGRKKKDELISNFNKDWDFLNESFWV